MNSRSQFLALGSVIGAGVGLANTASAYHFECRLVERVGNTDVVLVNNYIDATNGQARNIGAGMNLASTVLGCTFHPAIPTSRD